MERNFTIIHQSIASLACHPVSLCEVYRPKETGQQHEAVALVENCARVLTWFAQLGVGNDRAQATGVAAVDGCAHAVDDMRDLTAAAEEDAAHISHGDPGALGTVIALSSMMLMPRSKLE